MTAAAPPRPGLAASASVTADVSGGRQRIRWSHAWPVLLRQTGDARVHLVHGAGGPLGGDELALDVRIGDGAALEVRSAGATIVQPGRVGAAARWDTTVTVGVGGTLDWAPEPTVVTDTAAFETTLRIDLAAGSRAGVREIVVLGRHGCVGGCYRGRLAVTLAGEPLLVHQTLLDGADPALTGPGGLGGARAVGSLLILAQPAAPHGPSRTGEPSGDGAPGGDGGGPGGPGSGPGTTAGERPGVRWARTALAAGAELLLAVGDPGPVITVLEAAQAGMTQP